MDRHSAKEKPGVNAKAPEKDARAQAAEKDARAQAQKSEKGVCIICGEARAGTPAAPEFPIRAARRLRSILKQPAKHTIACGEHLEEAKAKRAKFEKKVRDYSYGAILFFAIVAGGSFFFGRGDLGLFVPALLGAVFVALLPYFYYFPSFGK